MKKVLIVDDEKLIRIGLQSIIKRKYGEEYEAILCSNGREALEVIIREDIYFVITDIRMPECDGIEFLKELLSKGKKMPIIILSGYDDFNYAVDALRYGAKDYLLKPIKKDELYECIEKIEREYELNNDSTACGNLFITDEINDRFNIMLLNKKMDDETIKSEISRLCPNVNEDSYYIGILFNKELALISSNERNEKYNEFLKAMIRSEENICVFVDSQDNLNIIFDNNGIIEHMGKWLNDNKKYGYYCGVSDKLNNFNQFKTGYNNATLALKSKILSKDNERLLVFDYILEKDKAVIPFERIEKIINLIGTTRRDSLTEVLNLVYAENVAKANGIGYIEKCNETLLSAINVYLEQNLSHNIELKNRFEVISNILNYDNYREFYYELKELIFYVDELLFEVRKVLCDKSFIGKAIEYINNNYDKDLSLTVVSNVVSVNYSYFSQVFKEHTGESFIAYLKNLRVKRAKQLLSQKNMKVYEIAQAVGYSDSKQFTKAFKSVTGITPQEFREKQLIN